MSTVEVRVQLKPDVLDPQGRAILKVLHGLGFTEVTSVRVGKVFVLEMDDGAAGKPAVRAATMAEKVLANVIVEDFDVAAR